MATAELCPHTVVGAQTLIQGPWDPRWTTQGVLDLVSLGACLSLQHLSGAGSQRAPILLLACLP